MIVETSYIKNKLSEIWPRFEIKGATFWDPKYWLIPEAQVKLLIEKSTVHEMDFIPQFNDCDNFALQFQAETRRKRYLSWKSGNLIEEQKYPVALAIVHGMQFRGISKNHVANLFVCQEGVYIADLLPMEKRYWLATPENDNIITVDFR